MDDQLYTLEDWLEGKIGADGNEEEVNELILDYILHKRGLPPDEVKKINEHRNQAFDWAVEINIDTQKWTTKDKIQRVRNPENWLRLEIEKIERFINANPELEQAFEECKRDTSLISGKKYKSIVKSYKTYQNGGKSISIIQKVERADRNQKGKRVPSELQVMYENIAYLGFLNEVKENLRDFINANKVGRPLIKKEIMKAVKKYHDDHADDLKDLTDTEKARTIIAALDSRLGITFTYEDPERSVKYWINGY